MTGTEATLRVVPGARVGDLLRDGERTLRYATDGSGRYFRLGGAEGRLLTCFVDGSTVSAIAAASGVSVSTVAAASARLASTGLLEVEGEPRTARSTPTDHVHRTPRVERVGATGRLVLVDPGPALGRFAAGRARAATIAAWWAVVGAALVTLAICVAKAPTLVGDLGTYRRTWPFWVTLVATGVVGTWLHELGHAVASVVVGGDATEIGLRWRGPFAAFYCRTDAVRVVIGRRRRAVVALAGPVVGLALAAPFLIAWTVTPTGPTAVAGLALVVSSLVNLLPLPGLDGYQALNHAVGHVGLFTEGVADLRARRWGAGLGYLVPLLVCGVLGAAAVLTVWFVTLTRWWGSTSAAFLLGLEALVVLLVVATARRRRRTVPITHLTPRPAAVPAPSLTPRRQLDMAHDQVVTMRGVSKDYGSGRGVFDVDLTIGPGSIHGLIGPNGAGKTTMMRVLLGLARPTSGTVTLLGSPAGSPAAMSRVGALIETPRMRPGLTGRTNLSYLARLAGRGDADVTRALETVGLRGSADHRFGSYSLGMKQRLGLGAALLKDPEVLVLDEPMNGLDPLGMADLRELLTRLRAEGRTIVLSSHQMSDVEALCDHVTVLEAGRVTADDTLAGFTGGTGPASYVIEATPVDTLVRLLAGHPLVTAIRQADGVAPGGVAPGSVAPGGVVADITVDVAPDVLHDIVLAGLRVSRFDPTHESLERAFLGAVRTGSVGSVGSDTFARHDVSGVGR